MEKVIIGLAILVVAVVCFVLLMRQKRFTKTEQDFMFYVHDQAKQIRLPKKEIHGFVSQNFEQLQVEFSINGPTVFNDVPRLIQAIVNRYQPT